MSKFNNILIFAIGFLIELLGSSGVELCADIPFDKNGVSKKKKRNKKRKRKRKGQGQKDKKRERKEEEKAKGKGRGKGR